MSAFIIVSVPAVRLHPWSVQLAAIHTKDRTEVPLFDRCSDILWVLSFSLYFSLYISLFLFHQTIHFFP